MFKFILVVMMVQTGPSFTYDWTPVYAIPYQTQAACDKAAKKYPPRFHYTNQSTHESAVCLPVTR